MGASKGKFLAVQKHEVKRFSGKLQGGDRSKHCVETFGDSCLKYFDGSISELCNFERFKL